MWPNDFTKEEDIAGGILQRRRTALGHRWQEGSGDVAANGFLRFSHKKTVLSKKDISVLAVSTVTIRHIVSDNAKIF